ncbi:MAG TPA: tetratricopeptide repeat protein, partial [Urbifossiella sp.]|nr:tetratricopeptide repeat protein [Urbifossiella sp.]
LAADRAARPADAAAVAGAVTAYLASAQERLRRAEVDRAAAVARAAGERRARRLMLALATALLAGAGAAAWQAVVADKARQTAETAADAESTAKKDALDAAAREAAAKKDALAAAAAAAAARKTAETKGAETRAILGFVDDHILSAARPKGLRGGLGPNVTLRAAIEAAVPFVGTGFKDQPLTEARLRKILGDSFQMMGDGKAAAAQYEPARAAYERLLGPNDLVTLAITNDLGISYNMGGRWRDSVALYEQILPRCQAKFGPGSDLTLACQSNLAAGYIRLGQVDRAAPIMKDVLDATRARYGPGDRNTLQSVGNLAGVYATQRRYDEALALGLEGLEAAKTALGPDDFDTLIAAHNLAIIYRGFGQYAEALRHDQDTLRRRINTLTHGHPETVNSLCAVAEDLFYFGRGAEAVPLLDESLRQNKGRFVSRSFPMVATQRLKIFEAARDAAGCRATAELWEGQGRADDASLYAAAKCRAVTAAVLRATAPSPAAAAAADADARRGLVWLIRARVAGAPAAEIRDERGFDALRADAEFQRLAFE